MNHRLNHSMFDLNRAPNSTLINGLGRYKGGPASPLAVVNVAFGLRYADITTMQVPERRLHELTYAHYYQLPFPSRIYLV